MSMDNIWKFNLARLVLRNMKHLYNYQVGFCKNKDSCAWRRKAEVLPLPPEAVLEGRALEQRLVGGIHWRSYREASPKANLTNYKAPSALQ